MWKHLAHHRGKYVFGSLQFRYLLSQKPCFFPRLIREVGVVPQTTSRWRPTTLCWEPRPPPPTSPGSSPLSRLPPFSASPSHSRSQAESHTEHFVSVSRFLEGHAE